MAANLLIRELDDDTNAALDRIKETRDIKANTDAALLMINEYWSLKERVGELERQVKVYDSLVHRLSISADMEARAKAFHADLIKDISKFW